MDTSTQVTSTPVSSEARAPGSTTQIESDIVEDEPNPTRYHGHVEKIDHTAQFGFVSSNSDLPSHLVKKELYFKWHLADDDKLRDVKKNDRILFTIDEFSSNDRPSINTLILEKDNVEIPLLAYKDMNKLSSTRSYELFSNSLAPGDTETSWRTQCRNNAAGDSSSSKAYQRRYTSGISKGTVNIEGDWRASCKTSDVNKKPSLWHASNSAALINQRVNDVETKGRIWRAAIAQDQTNSNEPVATERPILIREGKFERPREEADPSQDVDNEEANETDQTSVEYKIPYYLKRREMPSSGYQGRITFVHQQSFGYIEPMDIIDTDNEGNIKFQVCDVKPDVIPLCKNDQVRFILGSHRGSTNRAIRISVTKYSHRTREAVKNVLSDIQEKIRLVKGGVQVTEDVINIVRSLPLWSCIGNCLDYDGNCVQTLLDVVGSLQSLSGIEEHFKGAIRTLCGSNMFSASNRLWPNLIKEVMLQNDEDMLCNIKAFFMSLIEIVPEMVGKIAKFMKPTVNKDPRSNEYFFFKLLIGSLKCVTENGSYSQDWNELPLIPPKKEILLSNDTHLSHLQPVKVTGSYESPEEYFEVYFRLLRSDCFSSMNKGIRDLLQGTLDKRDMRVYNHIRFYGVHFSSNRSPMSIAIQLLEFAFGKWRSPKNLMFGNLVCISMNGSFEDALWATVVSRDLLPEMGIVLLELCSASNDIHDGLAMQYLSASSSTSVMIESPTYYRAYQPILQNLQDMDPDKMPFKEELVDVNTKNLRPSFVRALAEINASYVYEDHKQMYLTDFSKVNSPTRLDNSQERAVKNSIMQRVAIIQGPPGTGKTTIGVKLSQVIESLFTRPESPILILTYKNHALDEFIKAIVDLFPDKVARIGGGKQDPALERYNLFKLKRSEAKSYGRTIMELKNVMNDKKRLLECDYKNYCLKQRLNFDMFMKHTDSKQLRDIVQHCNWQKVKLRSILSVTVKDSDGFTEVGKKGRVKQAYVDEQEVQKILEIAGHCLKTFLRINHEDEVFKAKVTELIYCAFRLWLPTEAKFTEIALSFKNSRGQTRRAASTYRQPLQLRRNEVDDQDSTRDRENFDVEAKNEEEDRKAAIGEGLGGKKIEHEEIVTAPQFEDWMPQLFPLPKDISEEDYATSLLCCEKLWTMDQRERVLFVQLILKKESDEAFLYFSSKLSDFRDTHKKKAELEQLQSVAVLQRKKFIGMTITGASIHSKLLSQLKPAVLIVEEAAEVMEPQLLSCLGPWVQQLILIGDHKQLRPNVENFELRKTFHLDLSLMERLINNGLPYSTLSLQNRMRPEFALLLKDIYPALESNISRVGNNKSPPSCKYSMFFWTHNFQETNPESQRGKSKDDIRGRSFSNDEEAKRCVRLARYFVNQGHLPDKITILGAYLEQVKLLRKKNKALHESHGKPQPISDVQTKIKPVEDKKASVEYASEEEKASKISETKVEEADVLIQTIDNYQGDENDIVIISLVRSNPEGKIGFLNTINRRCVAQSRAKCGMYFIGNDETIAKSKVWQPLLDSMKTQGLLGPTIPLHCQHHNSNAPMVTTAKDIPIEPFCHEVCGMKTSCGRHECSKTCQPLHSHNPCTEIVKAFTFETCGHPGEQKCFEDVKHLKCYKPIDFTYRCGIHRSVRECWQNEDDLKCEELIKFQYPCSHIDTRKCYEDQDQKLCQAVVEFNFKKCGHPGTKTCFESEDAFICFKLAPSELECGHWIEKICSEPESMIKCKEKCKRLLTACQHPCEGICGDSCDPTKCEQCDKIRAAEQAKQNELEIKKREEVCKQVDAYIAELKTMETVFSINEITSDGPTCLEYFQVHDMVMKYIHPMHKWYPEITKIEKIENTELEIKFSQCKKTLFDPTFCLPKFHGTSDSALQSIVKDGFKLPKPGNHMFGQGIYFATDSSKSAQELYTKGSMKLLLCDVLLGKALAVKRAMPLMTGDTLNEKGYDSVYAPRGTEVKNDEFVVYDPYQALPKYIIQYELKKVDFKRKMLSTPITGHAVEIIKPHRAYKANDPLQMHLRVVESQFLRLHRKDDTFKIPTIRYIEYHENAPLVAKFKETTKNFERLYGKDTLETQIILGFHGTKADNIDSIAKNNFDLSKVKRSAHGRGIYFSEYPNISTVYGNALLLCQILPGRSFEEKSFAEKEIPTGYNSIAVRPDAEGTAKMLVINNIDQILPCYVVHIEKPRLI